MIAELPTLLRLALRRDRTLLAVGLVVPPVAVVASAQATKDLYGDGDLSSYVAIFRSGAAELLYGRLPAVNIDAISVLKGQLFGIAVVIAVAVAMTIRHTRGDEEAGRSEVLLSTALPRSAPLVSVLVEATGYVALASALVGIGLVMIGLDPAGTLAFSLGWLMMGWFCVALAALLAQLVRSARSVRIAAASLLLAGYFARGVADIVPSLDWLSWVTPFGWNEQIRGYADNRLWVAGLGLLLTIPVFGVAFQLFARRDLGSAVLPQRPGRTHAPRWLASSLGVAWHAVRATAVGWLIATVVIAAVSGSIANTATELFDDPATKDLLTQMGLIGESLLQSYLASIVSFLGIFSAALAIAVILRLANEEASGITDLVLATRTSRAARFGHFVALATVGMAVVTTAGSVALGLTAQQSTGADGVFRETVGAGLASMPAGLAVAAVAALLVGWWPRFAPLAWLAFAAAFFLSEFGALVKLPDWVISISPWDHLDRLPGGEFHAGTAAALVAVAGALTAVGLFGFRRRDLRP